MTPAKLSVDYGALIVHVFQSHYVEGLPSSSSIEKSCQRPPRR